MVTLEKGHIPLIETYVGLTEIAEDYVAIAKKH